LYFYRTNGETTEPLFSALMKQIGVKPASKCEGLREFQKHGWVLVDATYKPVNELGNRGRKRDLMILADYDDLVLDLKELLGTRWSKTPIVLIKANVCRLLGPKLKWREFNVLNKDDQIVPFPSNGWQAKFDERFRAIVRGMA
jgi:hypothetical protein